VKPEYTPIEKDPATAPKKQVPIATKKNVSITVQPRQKPSPINAATPAEIPAQQW
jgi:hypothetical protein